LKVKWPSPGKTSHIMPNVISTERFNILYSVKVLAQGFLPWINPCIRSWQINYVSRKQCNIWKRGD
jgi:hypothetical protein